MQAAESMVTQPPFNAKLSALDAIAETAQFSPAMLNLYYLSKGNTPGVSVFIDEESLMRRRDKADYSQLSNEAWYRKQGYEEFHLDPQAFFFTDPETGEKTPIPTYYFKKTLGK